MPTSTQIRSTTPTIDVYVKLAQYPILCDRIRMRMREELFRRGIVSQQDFELEVKELAQESQRREGLSDPYSQEDESTWQRRLDTIRDLHTDNYFGNNLGPGLLEQLIEEVLNEQHLPTDETELTFNPEIAPWQLLFRQGRIYEALPPPEQEDVKHHLRELKVVLIKRLISDHLSFIGIAKSIFSVGDLRWIYERLIGGGKIGGKAAGMLLAWKVLQQSSAELGPDISHQVEVPETYFVGSEIIYEFLYINKMERFVNQKYLPEEEIRKQYPTIVKESMQGELPPYVVEQLEEILTRIGKRPFVVRSSSLLEDNLSQSFAGKYESVFCVNQGTAEENMAELLRAIRRIYASTFNPTAMLDRHEKGLLDYDERMALMIQPLVGHTYGRYFYPTIVGSGLSRNPCLPEQSPDSEDGILRLVYGFDKRAADPFNDGRSCLIPLHKPKQRHDNGDGPISKSPQKTVRVINMDTKQFEELPLDALLHARNPHLPHVASVQENGRILPIPNTKKPDNGLTYAITFSALTKDPKFVKIMRTTLRRLQATYKMPVEIEFAIDLEPNPTGMEYKLYMLQCHPLDEGNE